MLGAVGVTTTALLFGCVPVDETDTPSDAASGTPSVAPSDRANTRWTVTRVIDGDTIEVTSPRRMLKVRLIGIDTPETVHPSVPIECFGPEASRFATRRLLGEAVRLEYDPTQGRRDYYGRTLAYVWLAQPRRLFNLEAIRRGYALEYTYESAYRRQGQFNAAEQVAQRAERGIWHCPQPGS